MHHPVLACWEAGMLPLCRNLISFMQEKNAHQPHWQNELHSQSEVYRDPIYVDYKLRLCSLDKKYIVSVYQPDD